MPHIPANHVELVKRIQTLCSELGNSIKSAQEQREKALALAQEALKLVAAVGEDESAATAGATTASKTQP